MAFLATAFAIVLLIGESSYHRLQPQDYDKRRLIRTASRQAVAATALLGVALTAVVFLVTNVLYRQVWAAGVAAALAALAAVTWFALPLARRLQR